MAADTIKKLAQVLLQSTPQAIYTAPARLQAIVKAINFANVSGTQQVIQLWQSGSADINVVLNPTTLAAGEYGAGEGTLTLAPGDTIYGQATSDNGIAVTISGMETG